MIRGFHAADFLTLANAASGTAGVLLQFPLYGGIAMILTQVAGSDGATLSHRLSQLFVQVASQDSFALVMGVYSAVLGFFVPSGGGKWIIEAPYVMQAANELRVHLGWAVQVYNAAEALPNLVNPFWMLPLLGVIEKPEPMPATIEEDFNEHYAPKVGGTSLTQPAE